jgi:Tfp pilus assembly protein PilN
MTISGEVDDAITVTLDYSPEFLQRVEAYERERRASTDRALRFQDPATRWSRAHRHQTDAEYIKSAERLRTPLSHSHRIGHGLDYSCENGWLVTDLQRDYSGTGATGASDALRFTRDKAGGLVMNAIFTSERQFNLWCGDGCVGFSLGTGESQRWAHWPAIASDSPSARTPTLWRGDYRALDPVPLDPQGRGAQRIDEVRALLARALPEDVRLDALEGAGNGVRASVSALDDDALSRLFSPLEQTPGIDRVHVESVIHEAPDRVRMSLFLQPRARVPSPDKTAADAAIRKLLPEAVMLVTFDVRGGAYTLIVTSPDNPRVSQLLRAIDTSGTFRSPELVELKNEGALRRATIRFAPGDGPIADSTIR